MTLFEGMMGKRYVIGGMFIEDAVSRRLEALGLNDGTPVDVMTRKRNGSLIIKVRGTRLAIGKKVASRIEIKEVSPL